MREREVVRFSRDIWHIKHIKHIRYARWCMSWTQGLLKVYNVYHDWQVWTGVTPKRLLYKEMTRAAGSFFCYSQFSILSLTKTSYWTYTNQNKHNSHNSPLTNRLQSFTANFWRILQNTSCHYSKSLPQFNFAACDSFSYAPLEH